MIIASTGIIWYLRGLQEFDTHLDGGVGGNKVVDSPPTAQFDRSGVPC